MTRQKHRPQRTCVACRKTKDKRELIRVVRIPEGDVTVDPTGKLNGRGAYLCRQESCWDKGLEKGYIARALKTTISAESLVALRADLQAKCS